MDAGRRVEAEGRSDDAGRGTADPDQARQPDRPDERASPANQHAGTEEASDPGTAPSEPADPEQILSAYAWRFSAETLREVVDDPDDLRALRDRLTEKITVAADNAARARLIGLRAVVSRTLGDLGKALADGKLALAHAEATGELRRIAVARARLATVLHWRGDLAQADRLFARASSPELPDRLRAAMHEHAGRCSYDLGRYIEACDHLWHAVDLCNVDDPDLVARVGLTLDAVMAKVTASGWGPYARCRDEILGRHRPPIPKRNESFRSWGYVDADGREVIPPTYADAQPFSEGVAWVRCPDGPGWELIDEAGKVLIARGYDDVRPFRRGVAAVRRGRWGAIDTAGRAVVPMRYDGFATRLADGRSLDGFTDEGLAVVISGGRQGVVDRTGRVIVAPTHSVVVIHPVAFLIRDGAERWGALDRQGEPFVNAVHQNRDEVTDELDRLQPTTRPLI